MLIFIFPLICFLKEAHLSGAHSSGAQLSVGSIVGRLICRGLISRGSTVGAQLSGAQLSCCRFSRYILIIGKNNELFTYYELSHINSNCCSYILDLFYYVRNLEKKNKNDFTQKKTSTVMLS
jgi:hypothetical protein